MKIKQLMVDLMYSWAVANNSQVKKWENGDDWPELDALIAFRHLLDPMQSKQNKINPEIPGELDICKTCAAKKLFDESLK